MIRSMTAYAAAEENRDALCVTSELRSYNSRYLDITLKFPSTCAALEEKIRALISERLNRGRVEVRIRVNAGEEASGSFEIREARAEALNAVRERLRERFGWNVPLPLDFLAGAGGVIQAVQETMAPDVMWPSMEACLKSALTDLVAMRRREGEHLAEDLSQRLARIETMLTTIHEGAGNLLPLYRERLKTRIGRLTGEMIDLDPSRITQEAAILADKSDISEEITRARSHLKQFREIMAAGESAGRKLNFLLQEFNREFNTMGSKAASADISHTIVAAKAELEKIREQVQNVE